MHDAPIWPLVVLTPAWGLAIWAGGALAMSCIALGFLSALMCLVAIERADRLAAQSTQEDA